MHTGKLLTTPDDPSAAIIDGITRLLREVRLHPADLHSVVHGTTLIANTIIERTGATVGLLTTEGFRDSIEIGRETRYDLYDLFVDPPPTLVPRYRRLEIPERVSADGEVLLALDEAAVARAARQLVERDGCDALAIAFMHSYRAPAHEQRAAAIVRGLYPDLALSLSAEVAPEIREFERTSTACANAYVQPLMQRYLDRLETSLAEIGFAGRLYVMLSGGGITTLREAKSVSDPADRIRPRRRGDGGRVPRQAHRARSRRVVRHGRHHREDVPGGGRRARPQVRFRGGAGAALPERFRSAVKSFRR